ncbi:resistance-nodulation-cell division (RND) efflux membrane fusion protein [Steroidobacter agaridevorans]|uniref:Resistance-nodulation-cell division (RND) efflux membrane fusion protein n=2 Tax=Steroidobacter agaridevorans TaxID=2695856 RepID=A0A829Y6P1_9GAMM|nr:resistance-nodulation-cell division (RND) efflux membrane fusion protein [Steroidobacter agaridevorans]GFE88077.1 resistance-nodulation-cell division (RND) efflux membrane fusion protein [Steroidobacter agaridevorans]
MLQRASLEACSSIAMSIRLPQSRGALLGAAVSIAVVLLIAYRLLSSSLAADPPRGPPPVPVSVITVEQKDVPQLAAGIGTVQSLHNVILRPQVSGIVTEVLFEEGQQVKRGQLLARIDDRTILANLRQAEAEKARNEAQLKAAELDKSRYDNLLAEEAISRQTVEQQLAQVEQLEAAIRANEATIAAQQVQLSFTKITSPVNGRVGLRRVDPGNLVQVGDANGLVTVTQVDPISVIFTLPQELLGRVQGLTHGDSSAHVGAFDRDGGVLLAEGKLTTIDNQVDASTGTIRLRAEFANTQDKLWPGQFVTVRLQTGVSGNALVVPTRSVRQGLEGPFVFRVREQKAEVVRVQVGYSNDEITVITAGLAKGDSVVTDGHSRLTPNATVRLVEGQGPTALVSDAQRSRAQGSAGR